MDMGAPLLALDGKTIIAGNGRSMAIRQAYQDGGAEGYRQFLKDNANRFGIDSAQLDSIENPVLVRRLTSPVDIDQVAINSNEQGGMRMSDLEQAKNIDEDVRYSFAGENAKTANKELLAQAKSAVENGRDPEAIRQETGWFKGGDGKWRFELDDSDINFKGAGSYMASHIKGGVKLGDLIHADKLFNAYPDLKNITVKTSADGGIYYSPKTDEIFFDGGEKVDNAKGSLLHEVQHAIQQREGFAQGGSPSEFSDINRTEIALEGNKNRLRTLLGNNPKEAAVYSEMNRLVEEYQGFDNMPAEVEQRYDSLLNQMQGEVGRNILDLDFEIRTTQMRLKEGNADILTAEDQYRRLAGEVEARNVQIRLPLTEAQRKAFSPNDTQSIPDEQQWVRYGYGINRAQSRPKSESLKKLRNAETIRISGKEIEPSEDLRQYKRNALAYGKNLRGAYVNKDVGREISLGRNGVTEVLRHDYKDREHLQSIAAIPQIIENAVYIDTLPNEDLVKNNDIRDYEYYLAGLNIGGVDYTVRAAIGVGRNGNRYYDHKLTQIEKGKLLSLLDRVSTTGASESNSPLSEVNDKRLLQILQDERAKNNQQSQVSPEIQRAQDILRKTFGKAAEHIEVTTFANPPKDVKNLITSDVEGWFNPKTGKITIVADSIKPTKTMTKDERLQFVAWHEMAHRGINVGYKGAYNSLMSEVGKNKAVSQIADAIQAQRKNTNDLAATNRNVAIEEAIAEIMAANETGKWNELEARYGVEIKKGQRQSAKSWLAMTAQRIKEFLSKIFGAERAAQFSDEDVLNLVAKIKESVVGKSNGISGSNRYSTSGESLPMDLESRLARAREQGFNTEYIYSHGTYQNNPIERIDPYESFGALFTIQNDIDDRRPELAPYGDHYEHFVIKGEPMTHQEFRNILFDSQESMDDAIDFISKETAVSKSDLTEDEWETVLDIVAEDRHITRVIDRDYDGEIPEYLANIFEFQGEREDPGYLDWGAQRLRIMLAKKYGANAIEMEDENGTSIALLPGNGVRSLEAEFNPSKTESDNLRFSRNEELTEDRYNQAKENGETELTFKQWQQVRTPEFKAWFGDWENDPKNSSKVINPETGEPLVVYHGTGREFNTFKKMKTTRGNFFTGETREVEPQAFFFSEDYDYSEHVSRVRADETMEVKPVFLNIRYLNEISDFTDISEFTTDTEIDFMDKSIWTYFDDKEFTDKFREEYDGAVFEEDSGEVTYAVFNPNQIKSATDNTGAFSKESDDIRFSRAQSRFADSEFENAVPKRAANSFAQVKDLAKSFLNKPLHNDETGIEAIISRANLDKMLSGKAHSKSTSLHDHLLAVANVDSLFKHAIHGWTEPYNKNESEDVVGVHKMFAPLNIDGNVKLVKLTVKELKPKQGNRVYSVETIEIGNEKAPVPEMAELGFDSNSHRLHEGSGSNANVKSLIQRISDFNSRAENSDIRFSRVNTTQSALELSRTAKAESEPGIWDNLKAKDYSGFKERFNRAVGKVDEWLADSLRPVNDWIDSMHLADQTGNTSS